jgi:hypothetical protein
MLISFQGRADDRSLSLAQQRASGGRRFNPSMCKD